MSSAQKARQRGSSPARRRPRKPPKPPAAPDPLEVALEHQAALNQEYASLVERRNQIDAEMERISKLANQVVGRIDQIREMRGEKEPMMSLAAMREMMMSSTEPGQNGASAEERTDGGQ